MSLLEQSELFKILEEELITPVYQPIVDLTNGEVFGYESLSRGPAGLLANPETMFRIASQSGVLSKLDYLCRKKGIEHAATLPDDKFLFLNVDPRILYDKDFHQGTTKAFLQSSSISSQKIIFEITEKTMIEDYAVFRAILKHYRDQGYSLALDDVGSGYSGLTLLTKIAPQFMKIDIELIRDIQHDKIKQAIVKSLLEISKVTSMKLIAEGIETEDELAWLVQMGINYGQGYFLGRPSPQLLEIAAPIKSFIRENAPVRNSSHNNIFLSTPIGTIAEKKHIFPSSALGQEILDHLRQTQEETDIILVDDEVPAGVISKDGFLSHLATNYGVSIYSRRPIKLLIESPPLQLDYYTPIADVTRLAMQRTSNHIYDSIIITKKGKYYGVATIKDLLKISSQIELNYAKDANPLTTLPGKKMIATEFGYYQSRQKSFSAIYVDLDNFKVYNDTYGFDAGDHVLLATASLLTRCLRQLCPKYFIGHIGGDDFILFLPEESPEKLCDEITRDFTITAKNFYTKEHQEQGCITAKNRQGKNSTFPLMTISLAAIIIKGDKKCDIETLSQKAAEIKKQCKAIWENNYITEVLQ